MILIFILLGALLILLIVSGFVYAGYSTKSYFLCEKIKTVEIDFDNENLYGVYSHMVASYVTSLELTDISEKHACVDNLKDNIVNQCNSDGSYLDAQEMQGKWTLSNSSYYTDPYGIHINGSGKMYFIGLEQDGLKAYIPLFSFNALYPEFEATLKVRGYDKKLNILRELVCEK